MGQQQQEQHKLQQQQQQRQRQRWLYEYNNANFNGHYNEAITIKNAEQQRSSSGRSSRDNDDAGDTIMIRIYWAYGAY